MIEPIIAFDSSPPESGNAALYQKDKNEIVENWGAPVFQSCSLRCADGPVDPVGERFASFEQS